MNEYSGIPKNSGEVLNIGLSTVSKHRFLWNNPSRRRYSRFSRFSKKSKKPTEHNNNFWDIGQKNKYNSALNINQNYWVTHGKRIKDYRDVLMHYEILGNRIVIKGDGRIVYLESLLPDNPEIKSPLKFSYKKCNAIDYCISEKNAILQLIEIIFCEISNHVNAPIQTDRIMKSYSSHSTPFILSTGNNNGLLVDVFKTSIQKK